MTGARSSWKQATCEPTGVSDLDLVFRSIALALDAHGLCVVQQPVEQGRGEDGVVVEDAGPLLVDAVCGNQRGAAFIAVADDLEQAVGAELVNRKVAELVDLCYA